MKLISMTDYVLEQEQFLDITNKQKLEFIINYAKFIKQPLELWMFVPCDEDCNVLEEPKGTDLNSSFFEMQVDYQLENKYQQAKEKCLFEGFEHLGEGTVAYKGVYIEKDSFDKINIEGLQYYCSSTEIKLTATAIKQIGL